MFFDFQGQKVLLKAEFEGTAGLLAQAGCIFLDSHARREQFENLWVRHGLRMTKLLPFLVNNCPFYGSP